MESSANYDLLQEKIGSFGRYQIRLMLLTQTAYICISGSLLCTLFDAYYSKPFQTQCANESSLLQSTICANESRPIQFVSLLIEMDMADVSSYIPTTMTTVVMCGGVVGAAVFGYISDKYGRKSACICALVGCMLSNAAMLLAVYHWILVMAVLFLIGFFGSGYMVVNFILLTEIVGSSGRLLCSCLSGWPLGMMVMALVGYMTQKWSLYHTSLATLSLIFALLFYFFAYESPRWLMVHGNSFVKFDQVLRDIAKSNGTFSPNISALLDQHSLHIYKKHRMESSCHPASYTYLDLTYNRSILIKVVALTFCWMANSLITYGIYFNTGSLAGSIYLNTFLTGLFKGTTGVMPIVLDHWFGRKPILNLFVFVTFLTCWTAVILHIVDDESLAYTLTIVAIVGCSAIDPMWKVNHLYSAELFPTVVRNMARGVCNVGSRLGSLLGPQVAYLTVFYAPLPFVIYASLATVYLAVSLCCLPETKGKTMPDELEEMPSGIERRSDHIQCDEIRPMTV